MLLNLKTLMSKIHEGRTSKYTCSLVEASRVPDPGLPQNLGGQMPSSAPESAPQLHIPLLVS